MNRRTLEFACGIIVIGLLAGVAGLCTTLLLRFVEHLTYHYSFGTLLAGVTDSSPVRRAVGPMIGGALAGFGWWMLRRRVEVPPLTETILNHGRIPRLTMTIDAALQVLIVGSGASLGREGAPRQFAAALGDLGTSRWALTERDREILLACGAGAGLAAVYSVPVGGALFATAIILKTWHPRAVGTALITSSLAVAVASPVTHEVPPLDWPDPQLSYLLTAFAIMLAPLALGVGLGFNHLMARAGQPADEVVGTDTGHRCGRPPHRTVFHPISGAARERQEHLDDQPEQWADFGRGRGASVPQAAAHCCVSSRRGGRRHAHSLARDRRSDGICGRVGDQYVDRAPRQRAGLVADVRGRSPRNNAACSDMGSDFRLGAGTPTVVAPRSISSGRGCGTLAPSTKRATTRY